MLHTHQSDFPLQLQRFEIGHQATRESDFTSNQPELENRVAGNQEGARLRW